MIFMAKCGDDSIRRHRCAVQHDLFLCKGSNGPWQNTTSTSQKAKWLQEF